MMTGANFWQVVPKVPQLVLANHTFKWFPAMAFFVQICCRGVLVAHFPKRLSISSALEPKRDCSLQS